MTKHKIKHTMVIGGGHVVERFNRTLKENIQKTLDAMDLDRYEWVKLWDPIMKQWLGSTYGLMLNERGNTHKLDKGDEVRVMIKKKAMTRGYQPKWSVPTYKVTSVDGSHYLISDGKQKVYTRHELLKTWHYANIVFPLKK